MGLELRAGSGARLAALLSTLLGVATPANALEMFDGRMQLHGYYEMQLRTISSGFSSQWDLTQWYNILNLELEVEIAPDGFGPFDLVSGFLRVEGRFDCIYYSGCGVINAADTFGNDARRLPERLNDARIITSSGSVLIDSTEQWNTGDRRSGATLDPAPLSRTLGYSSLAFQTGADGVFGVPSSSDPTCFALHGPLCDQLAGGSAAPAFLQNGEPLTKDDPFDYVFAAFESYRVAQINRPGGTESGLPTQVLGPWRPDDVVQTNATLADRVNPLDNSTASAVARAAVYNTTLINTLDPALANAAASTATGSGALPYRPIPIRDAEPSGPTSDIARGVYLPSVALRDLIASKRLDSFDFNFTQLERAFNRGASQQDEGELKEAYLDLEMFDSRLWLRLGKQQIVWGKTELFRTTDQFNPVDLALSSLPSLEESRIALWALRGVWSFYEVWKFDDVRAELAFNLDDFEPNDVGACGEPYTPNPACQFAFGGFAHGSFGIGVAGVDRPGSIWNSLQAWEIGGRVEFRFDRVSFQISDFWGYEDVPYIQPIGYYERNVDPQTGRPRVYRSRGRCTTGAEPACLRPGPRDRRETISDGMGGTVANPDFDAFLADPQYTDVGYQGDPTKRFDANNALDRHHANSQIFTAVCASSIGFSSLDPAACGQSVFNSQSAPLFGIEIGSLLGGLLYGGDRSDRIQKLAQGANGVNMPLMTLSVGDGRELENPGGCIDPNTGAPCGGIGTSWAPSPPNNESLSAALTPEQEALIGCGPFWGTNCDDSGIDLLNAEASVLLQAFTGYTGTSAGWQTGTTNPQPGTLGFVGGPIGTTTHLGGSVDQRLPGSNAKRLAGGGPNPRWQLDVDGDPDGVTTLRTPPAGAPLSNPQPAGTLGVHPFTGQPWSSELAALSWNFQAIAISQSGNFDAADAYTAGVCSFVTPQHCSSVQAAFDIAGLQRRVVEAGGNETFGRLAYAWHSGGEGVARFKKRNVLGFAMDFAEDRSKANFSIESTWIAGVLVTNNDEVDGLSKTDQLNLTVSVDRPTFVNFINSNRTLLINTQWFFQYIVGYEDAMPTNGPWNVLATLNISTGYAQDRLLPSMTLVYDFHSRSGGFLPDITYRISSNFSATVGMAYFFGRTQLVDMPIRPLSPASPRNGPNAYRDPVEQGLSAIRERDEIFLRLRYTF